MSNPLFRNVDPKKDPQGLLRARHRVPIGFIRTREKAAKYVSPV